MLEAYAVILTILFAYSLFIAIMLNNQITTLLSKENDETRNP